MLMLFSMLLWLLTAKSQNKNTVLSYSVLQKNIPLKLTAKIFDLSTTNSFFRWNKQLFNSVNDTTKDLVTINSLITSPSAVSSVAGTANRIIVTNGSTNAVVDISTNYGGQASITTIGTITTGTWNGSIIGIAKGGTGQTTANTALNALLPSQVSNSGKYLTTDGTNTSWTLTPGTITASGAILKTGNNVDLSSLTSVTSIASFSNSSITSLVILDEFRGGIFDVYLGNDVSDNGVVFTDALSRKWKRRLYDDKINIKWYGAISTTNGSNNDAYTPIIGARDYCYNHTQYTLYMPADTTGQAKYYVSTTLNFSRSIKILGDRKSQLFFPQGIAGMKFIEANGDQGLNVSVENLQLETTLSSTFDSTKHGLEANCVIHLKNIVVENFQGDGVYIHGCAIPNNPNWGNSDGSSVEKVQCNYNNNGIHFDGCDANVIAIKNTQCTSNRRWGVLDNGFLGNYYSNCITTNNAYSKNVVVIYGGKKYAALPASDGLNINKQPDLYPNFWVETLANLSPDSVWNNTRPYYSGGAYAVLDPNNKSTLVGCYSEGGQPASIMGQRAVVVSGDHGAGTIGGGVLTADNNWLIAQSQLAVLKGIDFYSYSNATQYQILYDTTARKLNFRYNSQNPNLWMTANWRTEIGAGGSSGAYNFNSVTSIPQNVGGTLEFYPPSGSSSGKIIFGDGTGWSMAFAKRNTGINTDLFTFKDNGELNAVSFKGDGSQLTNLPASTNVINNQFTSAQTANAWISGQFKTEGLITTNGGFTSPSTSNGGFNNERFGNSATANTKVNAGNGNTAIGAFANASGFFGNTAIGDHAIDTGYYGTSVGANSSSGGYFGGTAIGYGTVVTADRGVGVGYSITTSGVSIGAQLQGGSINIGKFNNSQLYNGTMMLGNNLNPTGMNQLWFGEGQPGNGWISDVYFNTAASSLASVYGPLTFHSIGGQGTDIAGESMVFAPGAGTGFGAGGSFIIKTAAAGTSGNTQNSLLERFIVKPTGVVQITNLGNGSSTQMIVSDLNGNLSTQSIPTGNGTLLNIQILTSGTTYIPTSGTSAVVIKMIGGGGGVTGGVSSSSAGGGGGSGGYLEKYFTNVSGTYTISIGTAGSGGANTGGYGGAGGNTTFTNGGVTYTAYGGNGGQGMLAGTTIQNGLGGTGGIVSSNGDLNTGGTMGGAALRLSGTMETSGAGASSQFGGGGNLVMNTSAAGNIGTGYGTGGSGAGSIDNTANVGGVGKDGVIMIYEYK